MSWDPNRVMIREHDGSNPRTFATETEWHTWCYWEGIITMEELKALKATPWRGELLSKERIQ